VKGSGDLAGMGSLLSSRISNCPRMVAIPGGNFAINSPPNERERRNFEGPQEGVMVSAFAIGEDEVASAENTTFATKAKRVPTGYFTYCFSSLRGVSRH